jgi:hypothetical protein
MRVDVLGLGLAQFVVTGGALALFLHFCGADSWGRQVERSEDRTATRLCRLGG